MGSLRRVALGEFIGPGVFYFILFSSVVRPVRRAETAASGPCGPPPPPTGAHPAPRRPRELGPRRRISGGARLPRPSRNPNFAPRPCGFMWDGVTGTLPAHAAPPPPAPSAAVPARGEVGGVGVLEGG